MVCEKNHPIGVVVAVVIVAFAVVSREQSFVRLLAGRQAKMMSVSIGPRKASSFIKTSLLWIQFLVNFRNSQMTASERQRKDSQSLISLFGNRFVCQLAPVGTRPTGASVHRN